MLKETRLFKGKTKCLHLNIAWIQNTCDKILYEFKSPCTAWVVHSHQDSLVTLTYDLISIIAMHSIWCCLENNPEMTLNCKISCQLVDSITGSYQKSYTIILTLTEYWFPIDVLKFKILSLTFGIINETQGFVLNMPGIKSNAVRGPYM